MYDESHIGNETYSTKYRCPNCGSMETDYDGYCVKCGECVVEYEEPAPIKVQRPTSVKGILPCPYCDSKLITDSGKCSNCGKMLGKPWLSHYVDRDTGVKIIPDQEDANAIYRYSALGNKKSIVKCPRCGSTNCSIIHEQKEVPENVKTSYNVNLNPFKPFTLINKKEKVVSRGYSYTITKYTCNKCGKIFG